MTFPRDYPLSPPKVSQACSRASTTPSHNLTPIPSTDEVQPSSIPPKQSASSFLPRPPMRTLADRVDADPHTRTVYASGEVCISILHAPGDDPNAYESSSERWSPVQSVEKILLSSVARSPLPSLPPPRDRTLTPLLLTALG